MNSTTTPKKENPTEVWQPAAGLRVNSREIIALPVKTVAQLEAELAEIDEQLGDRKRLASLQARAALRGIRIDEVPSGFKAAGPNGMLSGRDLTSLLSDVKSSKNFLAQTSSKIAETLAKKNGLTPVVTATRVPVGRFSEIEYRYITELRTDWEILQYLAQAEDFVCWVRGATLYFGPRFNGPPIPWVISWQPPTPDRPYPVSNVQSIEFRRALNVSRGVEVIVMGWQPHQHQRNVGYYPLAPTTEVDPNTVTFGDALVYRYSIHGLTQEQCSQRAQTLYRQIVQHELSFEAEMPGDTLLDVDSVIQVTGTGTAYDQSYFPDSITRRLDWEGGFSMSVCAKNSALNTKGAA